MSGGRTTTVLRKEVIDNLRDRRTLISAFSLSLLGPVFFVGLMAFVLDLTVTRSNEALVLAVDGAEFAPNLVRFLEQNNVDIVRVSGTPRDSVRSAVHDVVLVIPPEYPDAVREGRTAGVQLIIDSSRIKDTQKNFLRASDLVNAWGQQIANLRLQVRGLSQAVIQPLRVESIDVSTPAGRAVSFLTMIPYLVVFAVFIGGFYLAIDTTTGEREQGSLEPLLAQPATRSELVLGKLAATSLFSAATLVMILIMFAIALPFAPLERVGMAVHFGLGHIGAIALVCLPLVLFAAALLTVIASFSKSFKEAQTYLSLVVIVPTLPLIIASLLSLKPTLWSMVVPSLSQALLMTSILKGETIAPSYIVLSAASTLLAGLLLSVLAIRMYERESLLG